MSAGNPAEPGPSSNVTHGANAGCINNCSSALLDLVMAPVSVSMVDMTIEDMNVCIYIYIYKYHICIYIYI